MDAPSASELLNDLTVQAAFAAAWADSFPDDPQMRHEEGGFIYYNPNTGSITIRRARPGRRNALDLSKPSFVMDSYLVGVYHTHPSPLSVGGLPDPSPEDLLLAKGAGVPFFIVAEEETYAIGIERRVGGCNGPAGYPI